jgi:hypothetical protein
MIVAALLLLTVGSFPAADTLPAQLSDAAYWKMISEFSEPDVPATRFDEWLTSNEKGYQYPIPQLTKSVAPGGVYLGVGPEQNFTYIAAVRPKIAFIVDIRREILLEHLMYKALFEISKDRAEFVSRLFSRKRPAGLTADSSVEAIFQAYEGVKADSELEWRRPELELSGIQRKFQPSPPDAREKPDRALGWRLCGAQDTSHGRTIRS